jgi:hypothetical protein
MDLLHDTQIIMTSITAHRVDKVLMCLFLMIIFPSF